MNKVILVVLYNKTINASNSLKSLLKIDLSEHQVVIYNNGPSIVDKDELYHELNDIAISAILINDLENSPLSIIYNKIIDFYYPLKEISIFDDDSVIPKDFFENSQSEIERFLKLPLIQSSSGQTFYPIKNNIVVTGFDLFDSSDHIISIGSGMIIYNKLIEVFKRHDMSLFDENFALYGVDYSFFRRVEILKKKGEVINIICQSIMEHSLSRVDSSDNEWRKKERLYDVVLTIKHYVPKRKKYFSLLKLYSKYIFKKDFSSFSLISKTFLSGTHPKCRGPSKK